MARKTKPLRTERPPLDPVSPGYRPDNSYEYKVKNGDSWVSLASRIGMDPKELIRYNFKTDNPNEVNWYLGERVGCDVPTPDGMNWKFSTSAKPGKIWLPLNPVKMKALTITSQPTISPLALEFEGPDSPLDALGRFFDVFNLVSVAAQIALPTAIILEGLMIGGGIVAAPAAMFVALGGPHEAALNELRKKQILDGLSRGIVLTADGRTPKYISEHGWVQTSPVNNIHYQAYGKQLQGIYNSALIIGIKHGQQFNSVAVVNLFKWIGSQMNSYAASLYNGKESGKWSDSKWKDYYNLCAGYLQRKIKLS